MICTTSLNRPHMPNNLA